MNEIEYILRIVLKARDELAGALAAARRELNGLTRDMGTNQSKIDAFNTSMATMDSNVENITNKFKAWRAVLQGVEDGNDDAKKSFGDLGRETEKATKTTTRAIKQQKDYYEVSEKLRRELKELKEAEDAKTVSTEYARVQYQRLARELEKVSKQITINTDRSTQAFKASERAAAGYDRIIAKQKEQTQSAKEEADKRVKIAEDEEKAKEKAHKDALADLRKFVDEEVKVKDGGLRKLTVQAREEKRINDDRARAEAEWHATRLKQDRDAAAERTRIARAESDAITNAAKAQEVTRRLSERKVKLDPALITDARDTANEFKRLSVEFKHNEDRARDYRVEAEHISTTLRKVQRDADRTSSTFQKLTGFFKDNGDSLSKIDNQFRGLGLLAVIGFANQLITVLGGLGGGFVAVAASAAQAGTAIGGMFVAGIGQALPAIGLLSAALMRVGAVMDAVKQAQTTQQQQAVQAAGAGRRSADATDAITAAQRRLRDAQEGLTQARKDAREDLEDLIRTENDAKLAAIGAALSQAEAQKALRTAQARGDTEGIQRAQLGVLEAQANAEENIAKRRKARQDAERGRRGGVEGMEGVTQAKRAVEDANRGVETAKRNAAEAAQGTITAAAQLNYLLAQLSPAERRLYNAITHIREAYKENYRGITDIIVNSFTRSVKGVEKVMLMPEVIKLATQTARQIGRQLNRIFDAFTAGPVLDQLIGIGEAGRKNLKPLTDIVISLGKSLINIAEGAGPAFSNFLEFVTGLVEQFEKLTGNRKDLEEYFKTGEEHFEAWITLALSVIELFAALSGAGGAETGKTMIEDATTAVENLTKKVEENRDKVKDFFGDAKDIVYDVVAVIEALAIELGKAFTPEHVENFTTFLKDQVIPALGDVIHILGWITDKLVQFGETPIGGEIIKATIALIIFQRIFSGMRGVISLVVTPFLKIAEVIGRIGARSGAFRALAESLGKIAPVAGRFLGIVGAVIALLHWLGLLDDAWREVKSGFEAFWDEVAPSFRKLFRAFKELWDVVAEGKGLFGVLRTVLRPLFSAIIAIGGVFLRVFGRTLGRIIGGAIDIITGIITFLTGVFTGDWRKAWSGIRQIFRGFVRGFGAIFRAIPELIGDIAKKILPAFRKGINALWGWLEKLPDRLGNLATKGAKAFTEAFDDVGGDVIKGILSGLKAGVGFAKDVANAFIDLINGLLPDKIKAPGIPDINLPNNPIKHLAAGGPVPGSGTGDRIAALLEPGEHVLTRQEVAAMGGHGAVFALRRALGGGGQGYGGRFAEGGAAGAGAGSLTITFQGGDLDAFRGTWRGFWGSLLASARNGTNQIETQFREMRVNTARSADRMYRNVRSSLADVQDSFKARGKRIVDSWSDMWQSLKKVTYEGLNYIGHQTNQAMKALGEKHIDFGLETPKKADAGKAGGGFIGGKGQRGRDQGFYSLGAGEAVLNWQHQAYVEPAMNAYYGHGLTDMYRRTRGYHAGGPEQTGFAAGGMAEIDATGKVADKRLARVIAAMMKRWKFALTAAGEAGHASNSDHHWGGAIDIIPGPGGSWSMLDKLARAAGWKPNAPMPAGGPFRWIGWNTEGGHGEGNHLHLSWKKDGPFSGPGGEAIEEIKRVIVTGVEPLKNLAQAALDLVRKAANKKLDESGGGDTGSTVPLGPGGPGEKIFDYFVKRGFTDFQAAAWVGNFIQESGLDPAIVQPGGEGHGLAQWGHGRFDALVAFAKERGKPWQDMQTQLDFVWHELQGSESAAYTAIKNTKDLQGAVNAVGRSYERFGVEGNRVGPAGEVFKKFGNSADHGPRKAATGKVPEFDEGGIVPGPFGQAVPIIAHAQEWVLNSGQVSRIAGMLGTSRDSLRSMMGFYGGGAAGYQGGGEPAEIPALTTADVKGIDSRSLRKMVVALRRIGRVFDRAAVDIGSVEQWSGFLDQQTAQLRRVTNRIKARKNERTKSGTDFDRGIRAFMDGVDGMLAETIGTFAKLRASIERRTTVRARQLVRRQFTVRGGVVGQRDRGSEEAIAEAIAIREQAELRRQRPELVGERRGIASELRAVRRQQRRGGLNDDQRARLQGQETQLQAMLDEAKQRVTDNVAAIYDSQQAVLQAQLATQQAITEAITKRYEAVSTVIENARRVATVLGDEGTLSSLATQQRNLLSAQADEIQSRIDATRGVGTREAIEAADALSAQVADIRTQITEMLQQELRDAMDRINTRAQRRLGRLDLGSRMLDALGRVGLGSAGGLAGERFTRAGIFDQRGQTLATQRSGLQGLVGQAAAQGNVGLVQELTDQLAELDVTIAENTKAYFDARVEAVNQRTGLVVQQADLKAQIITLTGEISGNTNTAALLALQTEKANALNAQRIELDRLLTEARLAGNTQAVNDLTTQMLENQLALLQNTQATNELTGNLSKDQGFTSTAFEVFSQAIFTGSGGLLPMYQSLFPSAQVGADVVNSGMLMAHAGEKIVPAKVAALSSGGSMGDTNYFDIDINEAGRPIDWAGAATQIMFKKSGAK